MTHPSRAEFTRHGMDDVVTLTHRNVCKDGFGLNDAVDSGKRTLDILYAPVVDDLPMNAVFLDLPAPWEAIPFAHAAMKVGNLASTNDPSSCSQSESERPNNPHLLL